MPNIPEEIKQVIKDELETKTPKKLVSYLMATLVIIFSLVCVIGALWYRNWKKERDEDKKMQIQTWQTVNAVSGNVNGLRGDLNSFKIEQRTEHRGINEKMDVYKECLDAVSRKQIERIDNIIKQELKDIQNDSPQDQSFYTNPIDSNTFHSYLSPKPPILKPENKNIGLTLPVDTIKKKLMLEDCLGEFSNK